MKTIKMPLECCWCTRWGIQLILERKNLPFPIWFVDIVWKAWWYMTCNRLSMPSMSCHSNHWSNWSGFSYAHALYSIISFSASSLWVCVCELLVYKKHLLLIHFHRRRNWRMCSIFAELYPHWIHIRNIMCCWSIAWCTCSLARIRFYEGCLFDYVSPLLRF